MILQDNSQYSDGDQPFSLLGQGVALSPIDTMVNCGVGLSEKAQTDRAIKWKLKYTCVFEVGPTHPSSLRAMEVKCLMMTMLCLT